MQVRWPGKRRRSREAARRFFRPLVEALEPRLLLTSDFGDAPIPYPTTQAEGGAEHIAGTLTLGANIDTEDDGTHSSDADHDDSNGTSDEDGVSFGVIQVGALDAEVTVNVQGGVGKLDAWIDFNRDGSWGGPGEHVFASVDVSAGNNDLTFDVPSWALSGDTFARFRFSAAGGLGVGGVAADGEVEDYRVTVLAPAVGSRVFRESVIATDMGEASSVFAADIDGDGDMDVLGAAQKDDQLIWYENDGDAGFTAHPVGSFAEGPGSVFAADVDNDGDTDVLSASLYDGVIAWYENDGNASFTQHTIVHATWTRDVFAADLDGDGDTDILGVLQLGDTIAWYENDGNEAFTAHTVTNEVDGPLSVYATDVDGDGDVDVLGASFNDDLLTWSENDGAGNFTTHTVSTTADGPFSVFAVDLDGDGDTDVLSARALTTRSLGMRTTAARASYLTQSVLTVTSVPA